MNNNIIPACIIGAGLFYVGANLNKEQESKVIQAEPVVAKTAASSTGVGEPVIVWYDAVSTSGKYGSEPGPKNVTLLRAWSDGTIEMKAEIPAHWDNGCPDGITSCGWVVISTPQMACRTDINGNGEIEFGDLLAVLNDWGTETTCPDVVQLQCGLTEMN